MAEAGADAHGVYTGWRPALRAWMVAFGALAAMAAAERLLSILVIAPMLHSRFVQVVLLEEEAWPAVLDLLEPVKALTVIVAAMLGAWAAGRLDAWLPWGRHADPYAAKLGRFLCLLFALPALVELSLRLWGA